MLVSLEQQSFCKMKKTLITILIGLLLAFPILAAYEDFTSWTEVDSGTILSQTATKSSFASMSCEEENYLYYDYTVDHFDGDFEHKFDYEPESISGEGMGYPWGMANELDDMYNLIENDKDQFAYVIYPADPLIRLYATENTATQYDSFLDGNAGEQWWVKIVRNETTEVLYAYIYNAPGWDSGDLQDTLVLGLNEKEDFRYLFAPSCYNNGVADRLITGYVENLDIGEAVAAPFIPTSQNMILFGF